MSKIIDSPGAMPFEELIIQMFESQANYKELKAIHDYITKYQRDYALIHLYTLLRCLEGYYKALAITE